MKKKVLIGVVIVAGIIILLLAATVSSDDVNTSSSNNMSNDPNEIIENAEKESAAAKKKDLPEMKEITVEDWLNYYSEDKKTIILVASPTCHYCEIAEPIIKEIIKEYKIDIKYLNSGNFTQEESLDFMESDEFLNEGFGTPLLTIVGNNMIIGKVDGLTDKAHYIDFFKTYEIIK